MHIKHRFAAGIVVAIVAAVPVVGHADPWTPSDDYSDSTTTTAANPLAIESDGTYVYVVGGFGASAIVRRRLITGGAWKQVDSYIMPGGHFAVAQAIVYDAANTTLYMFGHGDNASDSLGTTHWYVRTSLDGVAWHTIFTGTYFVTDATNSVADAKLSTDNGELYVALDVTGETITGMPIDPEWVVLKSSNGTKWTTVVTNAAGSPGGQAYGAAVGFDGLGHTDTAGYIIDSQGFNGDVFRSPWTSTWDHVASYQPFDLYRANGVNYSCGAGALGRPWIVRENKGSGWIPLETYAPPGDVGAQKMTSLDGVLYIAGYRGDDWYVRKSTPTGFGDSDVFSNGTAMSIHVAGGHLFVTGNHLDSGNVSHWITREL